MNKKSPVPLYFQLAEKIEEDISLGKYSPGDRIPSENELVRLFHIGRPTVRQAIDMLVRKRLLFRKRGAGTFVAKPLEKVDLFSLGGTIASFQSSGRKFCVQIVKNVHVIRAADCRKASFASDKVIQLTRKTMSGDTIVLIEDIYFDKSVFAGLEEMTITDQVSLSSLVEEEFGFVLEGGEQQFRVIYPDERLTRLMKLAQSTPILAVNRFLHSEGQKNVIYSDLYCRTDEFIFSQKIGVMHDE